MSENEPEYLKKLVNRNVPIILGIICIMLAVSLIGTVYAYFLMMNTITEKDNTISSLTYQNDILRHQATDLNNTLLFGKAEIWLPTQNLSQPAGTYSSLNFTTSYCGFMIVSVTSTANNTHLRVIWSFGGVLYDKQIDNVSNVGGGSFPVLATSEGAAYIPLGQTRVTVIIGNSDPINTATEIIWIAYHY